MQEKQPQSQGAVATQIATDDWTDFLRIVAPAFIRPSTKVLISKEDETISFEIETARVKEFQEHFDRVLQSSESLDLQLSYQHSAAISSFFSSSETQIFESPTIQNLEQAKDFMKTLFGADTMEGRSECSINFDNYFVNYENGVLISNPKTFANRDLAQVGQKFLCAHLNGVSVHVLRQVISAKLPHLQAPDEGVMDAIQGEGFAQTCFGIVEDNTVPKRSVFRMYFDIGRFLQLVYPPQIHVEKVDESKTRITISASHLLLYVKQLSRHGILFSVELKHGKVSAYPLLLPHKELVVKPLEVFIVLDDSGSMAEHRGELFKQVRSLIERIALVAPKAVIHLTIFSSRNQKIEHEAMAEKFNYGFLSRDALADQTAMYEAMLLPLSQMQDKMKTHNTMFMLFTDGHDNNSLTSEKTILEKISAIQKAVKAGDAPPVIQAIGYGKVNENVLNALAKTALHEEYTQLKSFQSLEPIIQRIEGFEHGRVLAEFKTKVGKQEETHTLPICLDGQPKVVRQVTIPLSRKPIEVSFNTPTKGQALALSQVTLQITATQAQQIMEDYKRRVEAIYADESAMPAKKIAELNGVLSEMNSFCKEAPQQIVLALATDLCETIENGKKKLLGQQDALGSSEGGRTPGGPILGRDSPIGRRSSPTTAVVEERRSDLSPR